MEGLLQRLWARPALRYLFVFATSAIGDFWTALYLYALSHGWIVIQALLGFGIPFINFVLTVWFIEMSSTKERLKLTFVSALGMTLGATLMLLLVR